MTLKDRWRSTQVRNDAAVAESAERLMNDTTFDVLRTRLARKSLVVAYLVVLALLPVAFIALGSLAGLLVVFVGLGGYLLLRISVRTIADLPDAYLDERQLALRNASYVSSYRVVSLVATVLGSAALVGFIAAGQDPDEWTLTISWNQAMAVFWVVMGLVLAVPSIVLALSDRID